MMRRISQVALLVRDHDEAIRCFIQALHFVLLENEHLSGGRVFMFLHTDDFHEDCEHMKSRGARIAERPRHESYGTVVVFLNLYGNKWDLIGPVTPS